MKSKIAAFLLLSFTTTIFAAGTNTPVAIAGDTVITAGSFPQSKAQKPTIVAYKLP